MNDNDWQELKNRLEAAGHQHALKVSRHGQIPHTYYAVLQEMKSYTRRVLPVIAEYIDETYNGVRVVEDAYTQPLPLEDPVFARQTNQGD